MSHLYSILIVAVAHLAERGFRFDPETDFGLRGWPAATMVVGSIALALLWQWGIVTLSMRRMEQGRGIRFIDRADRATRIAQWTILLSYCAATLAAGWSATVQNWVGGDLILIDLLLIILPPIVGLAGTWLVQYPVMRRLRHATMIRALDSGEPLHPVPSPWRYVLLQLRVNVLFLLVPLLLIVAASDVIDLYFPLEDPASGEANLNMFLTLASAGVVFLFAPVMARFILDLHPLPRGETREALLSVCEDHRVRVRDILLWRTDGAMINGAVMGLIGRLRYVMLTDALLESLPKTQVIAVMAHEIGHVRRHHMPWLIAAFMAILLVAIWPFEILGGVLETAGIIGPPGRIDAFTTTAFAAAGFLSFSAFGWVSRRFERQADAFAVQHLSGLREIDRDRDGRPDDAGTVITGEASNAMREALDRVSRLNGIDPARKSWRHGSIRWRQQYLLEIVGRPIRGLAIDRHVRTMKILTAVVLAAGIGGSLLLERGTRNKPVQPLETHWVIRDAQPQHDMIVGVSRGTAGDVPRYSREAVCRGRVTEVKGCNARLERSALHAPPLNRIVCPLQPGIDDPD